MKLLFLSLSVLLMMILHYFLHEENAKYVGPACTFASLTRKNVLNKSYSNILRCILCITQYMCILILKFFNTMECADWKMLFGLLMSG